MWLLVNPVNDGMILPPLDETSPALVTIRSGNHKITRAGGLGLLCHTDSAVYCNGLDHPAIAF